MTKQEFESRLGEGKTVTDAQYKVIEYVYNFYPAISETAGKDQIACLYSMFGMTVIKDMYPRAHRAEEVEREIRVARERLNELNGTLDMLGRGEWPDVPDVTDNGGMIK